MSHEKKSVAIIGSGPAGLMAAYVLSQAGVKVLVFDKKKGPGRKLLIAGSSGLNISYDAPPEKFHEFYPSYQERFKQLFQVFSSESWLHFIHQLGIKTFKGTSHRFFVEGLKASKLLRAWIGLLQNQGVEFFYEKECLNFHRSLSINYFDLIFSDQAIQQVHAICFCLGGASYEKNENPLRWPSIFERKSIKLTPFQPSNVGYNVAWPKDLLKESEGLPIKNILMTSSRGTKSGDLVITDYGLEGTPIYYCGTPGLVFLDLKPDLSLEQIKNKLSSIPENLSPLRRIKKYLHLSPATLSLIFHLTPQEEKQNLSALVSRIKRFPIELLSPQSLDRAISSSGGLSWQELDEQFMLRKYPGVFAAGEMLDWDAPTGGFLIQACVSQGYVAAHGILKFLKTV